MRYVHVMACIMNYHHNHDSSIYDCPFHLRPPLLQPHLYSVVWRRLYFWQPNTHARYISEYSVPVKKKVKWSLLQAYVAQRVGRCIALLFHDRGTWRGWVVSSTPRPHFTPGNEPVPILQEAGWAAGPVWTGGKSRPRRDSIPDRPARNSVVTPTELPGPNNYKYSTHKFIQVY